MWYNPLIVWILHSFMHPLLSLNMMVITYKGSKSGKRISVPVSYVRQDDILWVISLRKRTWWRSLRGGAPVMLRLRGKNVPGQAEAIVDDLPAKIAGLKTYVQDFREVGKAIDIHYDGDLHPMIEDLKREADKRVIIRISLDPLPA
jgi:hypothetical protein